MKALFILFIAFAGLTIWAVNDFNVGCHTVGYELQHDGTIETLLMGAC